MNTVGLVIYLLLSHLVVFSNIQDLYGLIGIDQNVIFICHSCVDVGEKGINYKAVLDQKMDTNERIRTSKKKRWFFFFSRNCVITGLVVILKFTGLQILAQ